MSVELIRDLLRIDQMIGKNQAQPLIDGKITLPENKPEINKILTIDGDVRITGTNIIKDKILINGAVDFKVLYDAEDEQQPIHSFKASKEFEEEIEIEGVNEQMIGDVKAHVEHIDYNLEDRNVISVKTVIELEGKVQAASNIDIVKDIKGSQGVQVLKESIKYDDVVGINSSSTLVKEAFEIDEDYPDILDILRVDTKVYEREVKIVDNKVIVAGLAEYSIMYLGDDEESKINYIRHEIPFTHFVEVPGATKEMMSRVKLEPGEVNYETRENINGNMRIIDVESTVDISAKVFEHNEKEVTVDTYSTNKKIDVKKQQIEVTENVGRNTAKEVINSTIEVSEESINNVYNLNVKPMLTDYRIIEEKVIVEGFLSTDMLYSGEDDEMKNMKQEIPFKSYVDIEGIEDGMDSEIDMVLEDVRFNKSNEHEVEVTATVKLDVSVNSIKTISIVTEAEELQDNIDKANRPSITIYIVQEEDTIWDIAKRYNTTVEELVETNDIINPDNIMPGEKIIIEKNIDFEF
ncbi:DUF3794 and LysM peptidoglycan-binding domain-containing protein [Caldisalinibacter kiritimatiensis]|uniref:LysM domain-containing membrane protein n=1 Tax=Caldisalinibacter kiritimatiensis TaxID=1304284 RepID=R1AYC6_9FIRM|nr:SPOCS domain-containing protein [Caldisalinibacter kiritimatiensis]EOD01692.1 LysM domain-containing membrane protein [Caldisalinibacter kiritimatiensis]